jgi:signal peptidase II
MGRKYAIISSLGAFILALDQWTKFWVIGKFSQEGESVTLFNWFSLTLVHNTGVAFGMLRDLPEGLRIVFLILLPPAVLFVLWWAYVRHFKDEELLGPTAMGLVLGGALGNLVDRIRLGYVIDFIDWFYPSASGAQCFHVLNFQMFYPGTLNNCHWPAFNVADSAITSAFVLLVLYSFLQDRQKVARSPTQLR